MGRREREEVGGKKGKEERRAVFVCETKLCERK